MSTGRIGSHERKDVFCDGSIRTPHLRSSNQPLIAGPDCPGFDASLKVGTRAGLCQRKRIEPPFAAETRRQPTLLKGLRREIDNWHRAEAIVGRKGQGS